MTKKKLENYDSLRVIARSKYTGNWKEVWSKYIFALYPISYVCFMRIIHPQITRK